jgi:hypothetical protein
MPIVELLDYSSYSSMVIASVVVKITTFIYLSKE